MEEQKKKEKFNENMSKNLAEMRNIALTVTHSDKISIKYDSTQPTCCFNPENDEITLNLSPLPPFVQKYDRLAKKCLDGLNLHECLHFVLTKPNREYNDNLATKIKRQNGSLNLIKQVINIVEDKRINHFGELRYRLDLGKRLKLVRLLVKDMFENAVATGKFQYDLKYGEAPIMLSVLVAEGLYDSDAAKARSFLSVKAIAEINKALDLLENTKYQTFKTDIAHSMQDIYNCIAPFMNSESEDAIPQYVVSKNGGKIHGDISESLRKKLEKAIKEEIAKEREEEAEKKAKELLNDLLKGSGAGEGTGREIPAPEPNFAEYDRLVDKNKEQITELLNKLKKYLKPKYKREIFQSRGKFMPNLVSRAYTNSFRREVRNVYLNSDVKMEKEKVAIGFLFDYSGSVDREEAQDITTILNEVFGHYVDDYGFAIACFGADSQKVKTFFETFANTKARIGNIGVNASGTEITVLLAAFLKMFNKVDTERRKILVIASDFCFSDTQKAEELIDLYEKNRVEIILIGFSGCYSIKTFASKTKNIRRTSIKSEKELPSAFLDVYLDIQR